MTVPRLHWGRPFAPDARDIAPLFLITAQILLGVALLATTLMLKSGG